MVSNAAKQPELDFAASVSEFNEKNSSVYTGGAKQIFCGGFTGELPEDANIEHVNVDVVWAEDQTKLEKATSAPDEIQDSGPLPTNANGETLESGQDQQNSQAQPPDTQGTIPVEQNLEPLPVTPPQQEPILPQSFLHSFFKTAHAQVPEPDSALAGSAANTEAVPATVLVPPVSGTGVSTPEQQPSTFVDDGFTAQAASLQKNSARFILKYSLDGSTWEEFGRVEQEFIHSFELPIHETGELGQLQISIEPSSDTAGTVYLDGMRLSVAYSRGDDLGAPHAATHALKQVRSSKQYSILLLESRDTNKQSLWAKDRSGISSWQQIADPGEFATNTPLALFDHYAFWLSGDHSALVGYDLAAKNYFSASVTETGLAFDNESTYARMKDDNIIFTKETGEVLEAPGDETDESLALEYHFKLSVPEHEPVVPVATQENLNSGQVLGVDSPLVPNGGTAEILVPETPATTTEQTPQISSEHTVPDGQAGATENTTSPQSKEESESPEEER